MDPCRSQLLEGGDVGGDGFGISALFACDAAIRDLEVTFPLLGRLPDGHEHLMRLEADGRTVEKTLSGSNRTAVLTVRAARPESFASRAKRVMAVFLSAVELGVGHILSGWDHLLFLAALLLGSRGLRSVVIPITAFTIAHSITLTLATLGVYAPSPRWVEPAIAASIAFVSFQNVVRSAPSHRWLVTLLFGLVHGFGFAGALQELALPRDRLAPTLLGFNVGVELGQIAVIGLALPLLARLRQRTAFEAHWQWRASAAMGLIGAAVCVMRVARPG